MITLREHIRLMSFLHNGKTLDDYLKTSNEFDKIRFLAYFEDVYPVQENCVKVTGDEINKKIHWSIEDLVLGQFIMIEQIITGKTKLPDHLVDLEILKLIVRPSDDLVFDNENPEKEKQNAEDILNIDIRKAYYILDKYIKARNKTLFEDFSGVFYDANNEDDDEDETLEEKTSEMLFNQQWYWYGIVRMLSNEDIHKYEKTYMLPMRMVLPEMSYIAQRNKIESARQRQSAAMRKL